MNKSCAILFLATLLNLKAANCFPDHFDFHVEDQIYDFDPFIMPDVCSEKSYCTVKDDEYPQDEIDRLLKHLSIDLEKMENYTSGAFDPESDCQAVYSREPVYYIKDESDRIRAVVQSSDPNGFHQVFDLRVCASEGHLQRSRHFLETSGVQITCNTSYLPFDFFVLGHGAELELEIIRAPLPVCCKCRLERRN